MNAFNTDTTSETFDVAAFAEAFILEAVRQVLPEDGVPIELEDGYRVAPPDKPVVLVRIAGARLSPWSGDQVDIAADVVTYSHPHNPLSLPWNEAKEWKNVRMEGVASVRPLSRSKMDAPASLAVNFSSAPLPNGMEVNGQDLTFCVALGERRAPTARPAFNGYKLTDGRPTGAQVGPSSSPYIY